MSDKHFHRRFNSSLSLYILGMLKSILIKDYTGWLHWTSTLISHFAFHASECFLLELLCGLESIHNESAHCLKTGKESLATYISAIGCNSMMCHTPLVFIFLQVNLKYLPFSFLPMSGTKLCTIFKDALMIWHSPACSLPCQQYTMGNITSKRWTQLTKSTAKI